MVSEERIPHIVHYCWYGKSEKPRVFYKCLESWKRFMPDWEIIEWNESNTKLFSNPFLCDAYKNEKWAFVSDIVRLQVVYEYGGIYLDTDVELYESLEYLTQYKAFMFFQNHNQLNTGLGFGAIKKNSLIKKMLDDYSTITFSVEHLNKLTCPYRNTAVVQREFPEIVLNNTTQIIQGNMFVCFDEYCTIAHHYGEFSWKNDEQAAALSYSKKNHKFLGLRKAIRKPSIFLFFDKHNLTTISKIYQFCVYDLIDYGLLYWLVRLAQKLKICNGGWK